MSQTYLPPWTYPIVSVFHCYQCQRMIAAFSKRCLLYRQVDVLLTCDFDTEYGPPFFEFPTRSTAHAFSEFVDSSISIMSLLTGFFGIFISWKSTRLYFKFYNINIKHMKYRNQLLKVHQPGRKCTCSKVTVFQRAFLTKKFFIC